MLARLLRDLEPFHPTLIGSFPLGLQVPGSDLDIACECASLAEFEATLHTSLAAQGQTARIERAPASPEACVASLVCEGLELEVFCQRLPIAEQAGFRHMIVEGRLLALGGAALRERVRALKRGGMKTEPAFAQVLGLPGDPYAAMLELERWEHARLLARVSAALTS
jgi:hypothetical protein